MSSSTRTTRGLVRSWGASLTDDAVDLFGQNLQSTCDQCRFFPAGASGLGDADTHFGTHLLAQGLAQLLGLCRIRPRQDSQQAGPLTVGRTPARRDQILEGLGQSAHVPRSTSDQRTPQRSLAQELLGRFDRQAPDRFVPFQPAQSVDLQLLGRRRLEPEQDRHDARQRDRIDGLAVDLPGPQRQALGRRKGVFVARQHHHRDRSGDRIVGELDQQVPAVAVRKPQVQDDGAQPRLRDNVAPLSQGGRRMDGAGVRAGDRLQNGPGRRIVVDHQDRARRGVRDARVSQRRDEVVQRTGHGRVRGLDDLLCEIGEAPLTGPQPRKAPTQRAGALEGVASLFQAVARHQQCVQLNRTLRWTRSSGSTAHGGGPREPPL